MKRKNANKMHTLESLLRLVELMEKTAISFADRPGSHTKEGAVDRMYNLAQADAYGVVKRQIQKMLAANAEQQFNNQ